MKKKRVLYALVSMVILLMISVKSALLLCEYVPNAIEVNLTDGTELLITEQVFGLAAQIKGNVENNLDKQLFVTNSRYGEILQLQWEKGEYFSNEKGYYAVIPDTWAADKEMLTLGEKVYTICGVYKTNPWERNAVIYVSPGKEEIFAEKALIAGHEEPVQQLLYNASENSGVFMSGEIFDLRSVRILALQFPYLGFFFGMCFVLVKMFFYGRNVLIDLYDWKEKSSLSFLKQVLKAIFVIGTACVMFRLLLNGIQIPKEYLPPDNLFDWTHYWNLVMDFQEKKIMLCSLRNSVDAIAFFVPFIVGNSTLVILAFGIFVMNCDKYDLEFWSG